MKSMLFGLFSILLVIPFISCPSTPRPLPEKPESASEPVAIEPVILEPELNPPDGTGTDVPTFDPTTISEEVKKVTFIDIRSLIENLNKIIQSKDFDAWYGYLAEDYRDKYSSKETLDKLSDSGVLKRQGIALKTIRDYFMYVVYPSRQNDRVDDIEFLGERTIKALTLNKKGERLVLYNLEKIGDTWKIAVGRYQ